MAWSTPKTDWDTDDGILDSDLNRIENNTEALLDLNYPRLDGFQVFCGLTNAGQDYDIKVIGGYCTSQSSVKGVIPFSSTVIKVLSSTVWAAGSGASSPCRAPGTSIGANQWWYIFALYNPTTTATDIALDTSANGSNIAGSSIESAGFTMWRRIGAVLEEDIDGGAPTLYALKPVVSRDQWFYLEGLRGGFNKAIDLSSNPTQGVYDLTDSNGNTPVPDALSSANNSDPLCLLGFRRNGGSGIVDVIAGTAGGDLAPSFGSTWRRGQAISFSADIIGGVVQTTLNDYKIILNGTGTSLSVQVYIAAYYDPCDYI